MVAFLVALLPVAAAARPAGRPGTLDPTFGRHGMFFSAPTPTFSQSEITGIARLADGKLLVAGKRESGEALSAVGVLTRRLPDGSIDPTFGKGGYVEGSNPDFSGVEGPEPSGLAEPVFGGIVVDSAGRILIGVSGGKCVTARVQRLLPDGRVDKSFGGKCGAKVPLTIDHLTLDGSGNVLVGGLAELGTSPKGLPNPTSRVVRLGPDGGLDTSYGEQGIAQVLDPPNSPPYAHSADFAVLPDGSVALATRGYVVRFTPQGKADTSFGTDGKASFEGAAIAVAALPDGRLAVAGHEEPKECCTQSGQFVITRYMPNGSLDPSFGDGGVTKVKLGGADAPAAIAAMSGEKLLLAGDAGDDSADCPKVRCKYTPVLLRLGADGRLDPTFGNGGVVRIPLALGESGLADPSVGSLATGPTGEAFLAATIEGGSSYVLEREANGAPAVGFEGGEPIAWSPTLPSNMEPNSVGVLGDGRIVLSVFGDALRHEVSQYLLTVRRNGRAATSASDPSGFVHAPGLSKSIYASGKAVYYFEGGTKRPRVMRMLPDGGGVPSGKGARLPTGFAGAGMTADGRGGIFAFGSALGHPGLAVAHVDAGGRLDRSFGRRGTSIVPFGDGPAGANALTVDSRGRVVAAGWAAGRAVATRLLPDGQLDRGFGRGGRVNLLGPGTNVMTVAVVDGDVVAGCRHETAVETRDSILVRLDGRGRRVRGFGRDGVVVAGGRHKPIAVLSSHGQAVLVTGVGREGGVRLRAYAADGRRARGWGHGGENVARVGQRKIFIPIGATVASNGQIVVAGTAGAWFVGNQTEVLRFR
jgi:uncharacterized delta-60 repeat protein